MKWVLLVIGLALPGVAQAQQDSLLKLWYNHPARQWVEALPIGNGRLGAMVFGDPVKETVQLNEITVWAGQPNRNDNTAALAALPEVRRLVFAGKYKEAQDLVNQTFISKTSSGMPYQTVGNLRLTFPEHEQYSQYYRELDIKRAVETTRYTVNGVTYEYTAFASVPDQVIVLRIAANKPGAVSFTATMDRPSSATVAARNGNALVLSGVTGDCDSVKGKVRFEAHVAIVAAGGAVQTGDTTLSVTSADTATLYVSIASSFVNYTDISADPAAKATAFLQTAQRKPYALALADHIHAYQKYFNRVTLDLGVSDSTKNPTDVRIASFANGNDPQLAALCFQYGRYLLISSSQPGGQPATLQGLWNNDLYPPWDSKYTVNINTEMNYWPSEVTNLSEMNEPLVQMIRELATAGKQTAKTMYGADGWVVHHNTDIWRICGPVDGSFWGMWPMGGAWLSQHLWEKYAYSGDTAYLASVYPILRDAVAFYQSTLVTYPGTDWLVVCPSVSPENAPSVHSESSISAGTTMDNQLLFDLFTRTIQAAKILRRDEDFVAKATQVLSRLAPMHIGQHGQLQEWMEDWDNPEDHHRHVSHLYGLFPSNQISPYRTPALFEAARTSLIQRGDPSTGWSMNWKINLWAHLLDGDHAYRLIQNQLKLVGSHGSRFGEGGGTYANMFDAHPPFQIDGNFGFASGIAEMLLQSNDGTIFLLPALPSAWPTGTVQGLRARGGFEIKELSWKNGRIAHVTLRTAIGGECRIRSYSRLHGVKGLALAEATGVNSNGFYEMPYGKTPVVSAKAKPGVPTLKHTYVYQFTAEGGKEYFLQGE